MKSGFSLRPKTTMCLVLYFLHHDIRLRVKGKRTLPCTQSKLMFNLKLLLVAKNKQAIAVKNKQISMHQKTKHTLKKCCHGVYHHGPSKCTSGYD